MRGPEAFVPKLVDGVGFTPVVSEGMSAVMPLSEQIPPVELRRVHPDKKHTAGHEFNHAYLAYASGVELDYISLAPSRDSLARTVLAGHVDAATMQVVAAGGCCATHDGRAMGFGSDLGKVHGLANAEGGIHPDRAIGRAQKLLSGLSTDIRERAAEIIAFLGEVPGSWFPQILLRAQMELQYEKKNPAAKHTSDVTLTGYVKEYVFEPKSDPDNGERTIIDDLGKAGIRVRYEVNGVKIEEKRFCKVCFGINGHLENCATRKRQATESKDNVNDSSVIFEKPKAVDVFVAEVV